MTTPDPDPISGLEWPAVVEVGEQVEYALMPGFVMSVEAIKPCEMSGGRSEPHSQYQVTDPEGNTDWLCGWDVVRTGEL